MEKLGARTKADSYRNKAIVFFLLAILLFFGVLINILFIIFSVVSFLIARYMWQRYTTWGIGAAGEHAVISALQRLDSSYKVINDIVLPGDRQNIDHIVVGSTGAFVIETKNHNGIIKCYGDKWYRNKVGRLGTVYGAGIGNPSRQAKRNAVVLKNWLQSKNIDVGYIVAVVVFTNEDVELKLNRPTVKVVYVDDLLSVFKAESNYKMTSEKINSVAEKLYQLK